ncbi:hypothetical protein [Staphylococcus cohnii]
MRRMFLLDLLNLFFIATGYMLMITLILFSFDFLQIQTTGSVFLESLSAITIFQFFSNPIFNGLFTLFLIISSLLFLYKAFELYQKEK